MGILGNRDSNIKKINVDQLRTGMFVHSLNCSWLNHPFLRNRVLLTSEKMIERIVEHGITEVFIDTSKGFDTSGAGPGADQVAGQEVDLARETKKRLLQVARTGFRPTDPAALRGGSAQRAAETSAPRPPAASPPAPPKASSAAEPAPPRVASVEAAAEMPRPAEVTASQEPQAAPRQNGFEPAANIIEKIQNGTAEGFGEEPKLVKTAALQEEIQEAVVIRKEAHRLVKNIMEEARLGKQVAVERAYPLVSKIADSILRNQDALVTMSALKKADDFTYVHSLGVCVLTICFGSHLYLSREGVIQAGIGALLHDVGKVKLPSEILNKAGKLKEQEFKKFKEHVDLGCSILSKTSSINPISLSVVAEHHENYDGTGYPRGLKGEEISIYGQMVSIANMYEVLTSERWYRSGLEPTQALSKLLEWGKFQFSEEMVHRFIRCIGIYPIGSLVRLESGLLAVVTEQGAKDLLHPVVRAIYDTNKGWFIKPRTLDLSKPLGRGGGDRIICHETGDKWKINPQLFLTDVREEDHIYRRLRGRSFAARAAHA